MVQAIYRNTGLTPDDVIDAVAYGKLGTFDVIPRFDNVHVMLYPKQHPDVKIQVLRYTANVWCPDFDQLDEIEDLLNGTFGDSFNAKPFKERDIQLNPGDLWKILETPLGLISAFAYYFPSVIADAVYQAIRYTDNWDGLPKNRQVEPSLGISSVARPEILLEELRERLFQSEA